MRTYEKTHPWLNFEADLRTSPVKLWALLGECQSKCEHIAGVPLRPSTADELYRLFLSKGALGSVAIEGNTLTEEEARLHLEGRLKLPPSREYLRQEYDNVLEACNKIVQRIEDGQIPTLSYEAICDLNKAVLHKLELDEGDQPGVISRHVMGVGRYRGAPREDCKILLQKLCEWLDGDTFQPQGGMNIIYAIIKAVYAHVYFEWIHPFPDGNGRTGRLIEFQILISSGVPAPAAHLLSNHYNQTKGEYIKQLDRTSKTGGDLVPFLTYAVEGLRDALAGQLEMIRQQVWDVSWRNYVYEKFRDKGKVVDRRRRQLILDLSQRSEPVPFDKLTSISPQVARMYSGRTDKTLARDLSVLLSEVRPLLEKTDQGYRARKEAILAFLPPSPDEQRGTRNR